MTLFFVLLAKIIPFYFIILIGFLAGKFLHVHKETVATLLIYIIVPAVIFQAALTTTISISTMSLPVLFFLIGSFMCLLFFAIGKYLYSDSTRNILAFTAGTGNTGYFGLPIAIMLFEPSTVNYYILCILGLVIYQNSLGFYITAKSHHSAWESFLRVIKLPTLYAFFIGIFINASGITVTQPILDTINNFRGAYTVLGMMIIGLGLASIKGYAFDLKFVSLTFLSKFILWPLLVAILIALDTSIIHLFSQQMHYVMILISIVPLAADTVSLATIHHAQPEKASLAVLLSTLFALFFIPFIVSNYIK